MIRKTTNYEIFTFREDNREKIDKKHLARLVESIKSRNLLELRPIMVNEKLEIVDGQHRLLAAKQLGYEIYYQKEENLDCADIVRMNLSKAWTPADYMNFHCKNNNSEYLKLQSFMEKHDISLKVAMHIALCEDRKGHEEFRLGEFKFSEEVDGEQLSICKETISYIRKVNGYSPFTGSARFWKALIALTSHESFNEKRWIANYKKLVDHFVPKPTGKGYLKCIQKIYNYNCSEKIILVD